MESDGGPVNGERTKSVYRAPGSVIADEPAGDFPGFVSSCVPDGAVSRSVDHSYPILVPDCRGQG